MSDDDSDNLKNVGVGCLCIVLAAILIILALSVGQELLDFLDYWFKQNTGK